MHLQQCYFVRTGLHFTVTSGAMIEHVLPRNISVQTLFRTFVWRIASLWRVLVVLFLSPPLLLVAEFGDVLGVAAHSRLQVAP